MAEEAKPQGPNMTESFFEDISEYWKNIFKSYTKDDAYWRIEALVKHRCVYGLPKPCTHAEGLKTALICASSVTPSSLNRIVDIYCDVCHYQLMRLETPSE